MATIVKRAHDWQVRWKHPSIRKPDGSIWQQAEPCATLAEAMALKNFLEDSRINHRIHRTDPRIAQRVFLHGTPEEKFPALLTGTGPTMRELRDRYLASNTKISDDTKSRGEATLQRHAPDLLMANVIAVTPAVLNALYDRIMAGTYYRKALGVGSAGNVLRGLTAPMRWGVQRGITPLTLTDGQPTQNWRMFLDELRVVFNYDPHEGGRPPHITTDEYRDWHQALLSAPERRQWIRRTIAILARCGLRGGELMALSCGNVDVHRGLLLIRHHMVDDKRVPGTKTNRKGKIVTREVPITDSLINDLGPNLHHRPKDAPLFPDDDDNFLTWSTYRPQFDWARGVAQSSGAISDISTLTPRILRDSYATWMAAHLMPIKLMEYMGHTNLATTLRYYHGGDGVDVGHRAMDALGLDHLRAVA